MLKTIRENIKAAYSLHDMNVIEFDIVENDMIMRTQSGIVKTAGISEQVDGYVEFHNVDWDFCFVYLLDAIKNVGSFGGKKMMFKDFLEEYKTFGLSIIDETYGYNQTKYAGYLTSNRMTYECIIEIYHLGDMVFVEEFGKENLHGI